MRNTFLIISTLIMSVIVFSCHRTVPFILVPPKAESTSNEANLIRGLRSNNLSLRDSCASDIRKLLGSGGNKIFPGNVHEYLPDYWFEKVSNFPVRMTKQKFISLFGIRDTFFEPNYDDIKFYRLDHFVTARTKISKRHVLLLSFNFNPVHFYEEPETTYTGLWRNYYVTGTIHSELEYIDGMKNGLEQIYSSTKDLSWENYWEFGVLVKRKKYNLDGEIISVDTTNLDIEN